MSFLFSYSIWYLAVWHGKLCVTQDMWQLLHRHVGVGSCVKLIVQASWAHVFMHSWDRVLPSPDKKCLPLHFKFGCTQYVSFPWGILLSGFRKELHLDLAPEYNFGNVMFPAEHNSQCEGHSAFSIQPVKLIDNDLWTVDVCVVWDMQLFIELWTELLDGCI